MKNVAIIGTGTMGPGMAATLARGGIDVACYDTSAAARDKTQGEVVTAQAVLERIGGPAASSPGTVSVRSDLAEAVAGAELVIEAVPENREVKATVFAELDRLSKPDAILASNTSGIPITTIQQSVRDPSRVVGMHWSNPPHVIPVIEVIAGEQTSPEVVERLRQLIADLGLMPVRVLRDVPGFVENRVLYAIMRECLIACRPGGHFARRTRHVCAVGDWFQAGRDPTAATPRCGRPRHLQRGRKLLERRPRREQRGERDSHGAYQRR